MKVIGIVLGIAFAIISGVMISLVRSGGALKPAGVIKPAEVGSDPVFIGKQIAVRLYPDFHAAKFVIWRLDEGMAADIPLAAIENYKGPVKPTLFDLRGGTSEDCVENCWYVQEIGRDLPDSVLQKTEAATTVEIFVQHFDRDEKVPETCEAEKLLTLNCMRPISVREVRRKIKTSAPHFFMQRYQQSQFYLYIENHPARAG